MSIVAESNLSLYSQKEVQQYAIYIILMSAQNNQLFTGTCQAWDLTGPLPLDYVGVGGHNTNDIFRQIKSKWPPFCQNSRHILVKYC
jgi:hypothetical protein